MNTTTLTSSNNSSIHVVDPSLPRRVQFKPTVGRPITPKRWLWNQMIQENEFHVMSGESSIGKTMLLMRIAATVTNGDYFPNADYPCPQGNVAYLNGEDDWSESLLARFDACGGDRNCLREFPARNQDGTYVDLAADMPEIEEEIKEWGNVRLLIVDPIINFTDNSFKNDDIKSVRAFLLEMQQMCRRNELTMIGLQHLNKNDHVRMKSRINGSAAWEQSPRIVLGAVKHPDHGLLFGKIKCNSSVMEGVYRYEIKPSEDGTDNAYVDWLEEDDDYWLGQCFNDWAGTGTHSQDESPRGKAKKYLEQALEDGEWHESVTITDALKVQQGVNSRTVQRAREDLGIQFKRTGEAPSRTLWRLPSTGDNPAHNNCHD